MKKHYYVMAVEKNDDTIKRKDPAIVARATAYSGKVVRILHVVSDEGFAEYAEH